ncbi:3-oxoacyl-[acyl-carrier-protein] synthase 2 [Alphaproteobacteria bacterium]|nr:3-oxoacyl-[acyl-carrier-protein] synthase 2 [Alphaproteobacteria bacterium]GHS99111.1 3-oxoacyl-[acyl-carrier-protein] synthase 2 [Alphaproteobacteria bacterium]
MMRRVVITGMGLVSPLGLGAEASWRRLVAGESGIRRITHFSTDDLASKIAGIVPTTPEESSDFFNIDAFIDAPEQRRMDKFIHFALAATDQALKDAVWAPENEHDQERTGVLVGAGIGGLPKIYENSVAFFDKGARYVSPFFVPSAIINLASGHISIRHKLHGPNSSIVTACASGSHAIGDAARMIQWGDADVMVAGGAESTVFPFGVAGFAALRALSTHFNEAPEKASRPWDKDRDGFVMGEGAGILILEALEHAQGRGAKIYGEVVGYGLSSDGYHMTAPEPNGQGAYLAMKAALKRAEVAPEQIGYINAHGTSTPQGDLVEARAIKRLFGAHAYKDLAISSTKSAVGHALGASGAGEAVFCVLALRDGIMPPTLNLDEPGEECDLDFIPHQARKKELEYVMSNSFGFGGTNSCLILKKFNA